MKQFMKRIMLTVGSILVFAMSVPGGVAYAQSNNCGPSGLGLISSFPTWYKYLELDGNCEVQDFEVPGDIWKIALAVVEMLLRIAGMVATGYVVYAGFKYVMSRGNPQEAAKARQTIIDAVIGIAIASIATVLVSFIGRTLTR